MYKLVEIILKRLTQGKTLIKLNSKRAFFYFSHLSLTLKLYKPILLFASSPSLHLLMNPFMSLFNHGLETINWQTINTNVSPFQCSSKPPFFLCDFPLLKTMHASLLLHSFFYFCRIFRKFFLLFARNRKCVPLKMHVS